MSITPESLMEHAIALDGSKLRTLTRGAAFTVKLERGRITYSPMSTRKPRIQTPKALANICTQYNKTGSLKPRDYIGLTGNSSYALAFIEDLLRRHVDESRQGADPPDSGSARP